jgi:hypothetical protein
LLARGNKLKVAKKKLKVTTKCGYNKSGEMYGCMAKVLRYKRRYIGRLPYFISLYGRIPSVSAPPISRRRQRRQQHGNGSNKDVTATPVTPRWLQRDNRAVAAGIAAAAVAGYCGSGGGVAAALAQWRWQSGGGVSVMAALEWWQR